MTKVIYIAVIFMGFLFVPGCTKKEPTDNSKESTKGSQFPQNGNFKTRRPEYTIESETKTDLHSEEGAFDKMLKLWNDGNKESVVDKFLHIKWESTAIFSQTSIANLSEKEFVSLPESKRKIIKQESLELTKTIRGLVKHILGIGKEYVEAKDYIIAEIYFNSALQCSETLSRAESLEVIRMLGIAGQRAALKELLELYSKTNNEIKLKSVKDRLSQF